MSFFDLVTVPVAAYPGVLFTLDFPLSDDGSRMALVSAVCLGIAVGFWILDKLMNSASLATPIGVLFFSISCLLGLILYTSPRLPSGEVALRGDSYIQLMAMTAGCAELGPGPLGNRAYTCDRGIAQGKEFTHALQLKAKPVLEPVVNRMADSGCVWVVDSLDNTVHCNAASDAARELDGKTLFQAVQPTLSAPFRTCTPVMSKGKAEVQPVFLTDEGKLYRFVHQRAIAYDCPDLGGTLSPAELSRKLMEQAFPA